MHQESIIGSPLWELQYCEEEVLEASHEELYGYAETDLSNLLDFWEEWEDQIHYAAVEFERFDEGIFDLAQWGTSIILHLWCKIYANRENQSIKIYNLAEPTPPEYLQQLENVNIEFSCFKTKELSGITCKQLTIESKNLEELNNVQVPKVTVRCENLRSISNMPCTTEISILVGKDVERIALADNCIIKKLSLASAQCLIEGSDITIEHLECREDYDVTWINQLNVHHLTVHHLKPDLHNENLRQLSINGKMTFDEVRHLQQSMKCDLFVHVSEIVSDSILGSDIEDIYLEQSLDCRRRQNITMVLSGKIRTNVWGKDLHSILMKAPSTCQIFQQLEVINLAGNRLTELPIYLNYFHRLKTLNLSMNKFVEVDIRSLSTIEKIDVSRNPLYRFEALGVRDINLSHTRIVQLPSRTTLVNVEKLDIRGCELLNPTWHELSRLHLIDRVEMSWGSTIKTRYQQLSKFHLRERWKLF